MIDEPFYQAGGGANDMDKSRLALTPEINRQEPAGEKPVGKWTATPGQTLAERDAAMFDLMRTAKAREQEVRAFYQSGRVVKAGDAALSEDEAIERLQAPAKAQLRGYISERTKAGGEPFQYLEHGQRQQRTKAWRAALPTWTGLFSGVDKMSEALPPADRADFEDSFQHSLNPEREKMQAANMRLVSEMTGQAIDDIAPAWTAIRSQYAQRAFGLAGVVDEATFYQAAGKALAKEKTDGELMEALHRKASIMAMQGKPLAESLAESKKLAGENWKDFAPAVREGHASALREFNDQEIQISDTLWNRFQRDRAVEQKSVSEEGEDLGPALMEYGRMPQAQREKILGAIALRAQDEGEDVNNYFARLGQAFKAGAYGVALGVAGQYSGLKENVLSEFLKKGEVPSYLAEGITEIPDNIVFDGVTPIAMRKMTVAERTFFQNAADMQAGHRAFLSDLPNAGITARRFIDARREGFWDTIGDTIVMGGQSLPMMAVAAVPYGGGLIVNAAGYGESNLATLKRENPNTDERQLESTAYTAGFLAAGVDRLQLGIMGARLPKVTGWALRQHKLLRTPLNFSIKAGVAGVAEAGQEITQDFTLPVVTSLSAALSEDIAGPDWKTFLKREKEALGDIFGVSLLFGIVGGAGHMVADHMDAPKLKELLTDREGLAMAGHTAETIEAVATEAETNPLAAAEALKVATIETPVEIRQANSKAAVEAMKANPPPTAAEAGLPEIIENEDGSILMRYPDGTEDTANSMEDAVQALRVWEQDESNIQEMGIRDLLKFFEGYHEGNSELGAKGEYSNKEFSFADWARGSKDRTAQAHARVRILMRNDFAAGKAATDGSEIADSDIDLSDYLIFGSSTNRYAAGVTRMAIKVSKAQGDTKRAGATVLTPIEEHAEGVLKWLIDSGKKSESWFIQQIRELETNTKAGQTMAVDLMDMDQELRRQEVLEAWSRLVVANTTGKVQDSQLPAGLKAIFRALKETFKAVLELAADIVRFRESGKMDSEFAYWLDVAGGVNEDYYGENLTRQMESDMLAEAMEGMPEIKSAIAGKLPHPDTLRANGDPLAGEVAAIYDEIKKSEDSGANQSARTRKANEFFLPVGEMESLYKVRESLNQQGFELETPADMLDALMLSVGYRKPQYAIASTGDFSFSIGRVPSVISPLDAEGAKLDALTDASHRDPAAILEAINGRQAKGDGKGSVRANDRQRRKHGRERFSAAEFRTWAENARRILTPEPIANLLGAENPQGGEHLVIFDDVSGRVVKLTKPGFFGAQGEDPGAYLERWALHNRAFGDDVAFEGLVTLPGENAPRAVISQDFARGRDATPEEQREFLTKKGFHEMEDGRWMHPVRAIVVWDTITPGNFIMTADGVKVIDLQVAPARLDELQALREETGLGRATSFSIGRTTGTPTDETRLFQGADGSASVIGPASFSIGPDYGGNHRPNDDGPRAHDLTEQEMTPADVYEHPEWYSGMSKKVITETMRQLRAVKGKADAILTIYRAGPVGEMNQGDLVSLSKEYARTHADAQDPEGFKVWAAKVKAADVRWAMDDLAEFGYFGDSVSAEDSGVSFSIAAYHGTPHKVTKFSTDKIGTGEGAQAYGWGLYFADSEKVARNYRDNLSGNYKRTGGFANPWNDPRPFGSGWIVERNDGRGNATFPSKKKALEFKAAKDLEIEKANDTTPLGNLYTVTLKVEDEDLLDWDKPLREQSDKVNAALSALPEWQEAAKFRKERPEQPEQAGIFYFELSQQFEDAKAASQKLASLGVRGIRYLDGNSRADGQGSYNYVIFDENDIEILEENGNPVNLGETSFSIGRASSPLIDAIDALVVAPEKKAEVYQKMGAKVLEIRQRFDKRKMKTGYDVPEERHAALKDLATLEVVAKTLPPAIRGKLVGSFRAVDSLKTEKGREDYMIRLLPRIEQALESHLKNQFRMAIRREFDRAEIKVSEAKTRGGKIGGVAHAIVEEARAAMKLKPEQAAAAKHQDEIDTASSMTPERLEELDGKIAALELFQDFDNADSKRLEQALELLKDIYSDGRREWLEVLGARRELKLGRIERLKAGLNMERTPDDYSRARAKRLGEKQLTAITEGLMELVLSNSQKIRRLAELTDDPAVVQVVEEFEKAMLDAELAEADMNHADQAALSLAMRTIFKVRTEYGVAKKLQELTDVGENDQVSVFKVEGFKEETIKVPKIYVESLIRGQVSGFQAKDGSNIELDAYDVAALEEAWEKFQELDEQEISQRRIIPFTRRISKGNRQTLGAINQLEGLQLWLTMRQPDQGTKMAALGYDEGTMEDLERWLLPETKALGMWMVDYLKSDQAVLDGIHRGEKGVGLGLVENYFPIRNDVSRADNGGLGLDGSQQMSAGKSVSAIKERVTNYAKPAIVNAVGTFLNTRAQVNFWKAHVAPVREWSSVVKDDGMASAIRTRMGETYYASLKRTIERIESGGSLKKSSLNAERWMKALMKANALSILGMRASTIWINLTAVLNVTYEVRASKLVKGMILAIKRPESFKDAWESPAIRRRFEIGTSFEAQIAKSSGPSTRPILAAMASAADKGMLPIQYADTTANLLGAAVVWENARADALAAKMTDAQAKEFAEGKVEQLFLRAAQPTTRLARSEMEQAILDFPLAAPLALFISEPRKTFAIGFLAMRELLTGKGTYGKAMAGQQAFMAFVGMQATVFLMRSLWGAVFKAKEDEEDEVFDRLWNRLNDPKAWGYAMTGGQLQAIPILGDAWNFSMANLFDQKFFKESPSVVTQSVEGAMSLEKAFGEATAEERAKAWIKAAQSVGALVPGGAVFAQAANVADFGVNAATSNGMDFSDEDRMRRIKKRYEAASEDLDKQLGKTTGDDGKINKEIQKRKHTALADKLRSEISPLSPELRKKVLESEIGNQTIREMAAKP